MHVEETERYTNAERSPRGKELAEVRRQDHETYDASRRERRRDSLTDNRDNSRTPVLPRKHDAVSLQVDRVCIKFGLHLH